VPASAVQASTIRVALHQLGAQAVDIQEVAGRIAATAARTREAGRPVALGPLESDLAALQQDLADLDKLLNQLDRSVAPH
jgi:hypothetical protein